MVVWPFYVKFSLLQTGFANCPSYISAKYCKTLYFRCILISRFWNIEISLHFNLAFSQCSTGIYQAFDRQSRFSRVLNFAILSYSWNSRKFDAHEKYLKYVLYSIVKLVNISPSYCQNKKGAIFYDSLCTWMWITLLFAPATANWSLSMFASLPKSRISSSHSLHSFHLVKIIHYPKYHILFKY